MKKQKKHKKSEIDEIFEVINSFFGVLGKAFNNFKNTDDLSFREKLII